MLCINFCIEGLLSTPSFELRVHLTYAPTFSQFHTMKEKTCIHKHNYENFKLDHKITMHFFMFVISGTLPPQGNDNFVYNIVRKNIYTYNKWILYHKLIELLLFPSLALELSLSSLCKNVIKEHKFNKIKKSNIYRCNKVHMIPPNHSPHHQSKKTK